MPAGRQVFLLLLLFLPTQLGLHFWPDFSFVQGLRVDYLSPTLYFTDILIILLLVSSPKTLNKLIKAVIKNKKITLLTSLFIFLNMIYSSSPLSSIYYLLKIFEMLFVFSYAITNFDRIKKFIPPIFAFGILFESFMAILQFIKGGSINGIFYFFGERFFSLNTPNIALSSINSELILRPYGTFPHPNVLAAFILIGTFFILDQIKFKKDFKSIFYFICLLSGFTTLLISLSRIPIVLYPALVLFFAVQKKIKPKVFISFFAGFIGAIFFFGQMIFYRFSNFLSFDESFFERAELAKDSIRMFYDHLFLGVGLGSFLHELPSYYTGEKIFFLQPVHNIFLLFASETGLIGFILLALLFVYLFNKTKFSARFLLLIIFTLGFFDHYFLTLQQGQLLLTLSMAYIFSNINNA